MIKVLIVEDSRTTSEYFDYILSGDMEIDIIGKVYDGMEAIEFIKTNKPDIITMDINMPKMSGIEATRHIMSSKPIPIVVVTSSRNVNNESVSIEALAAGAISIIEKPLGMGSPNEEEKIKQFVSLIKVYSQVKVIKRNFELLNKEEPKGISQIKMNIPSMNKMTNRKYVAIGISSGGPQVLKIIFSKISINFPFPIFVVQHITEGFLTNMVSWLNDKLSISVVVAKSNDNPKPGNIYFAPDNNQMGLQNEKIALRKITESDRICPSVAYLFENIGLRNAKETIALLLTGMGRDGAKEIKVLKDKGALTIAQDKESSLVHGMPGEAIKLGGVEYVLNPDEIAQMLYEIEINFLNRN